MATLHVNSLGLFQLIAALVAALYVFLMARRPRKGTQPHKSPSKKVTYRVQGIPIGWDEDDLRKAITNHFATSSAIAIDAFSKAVDNRQRVCTISFNNLPPALRAIARDEHYPTLDPLHPLYPLHLDQGFLGLSVLYAPPAQEHEIDVIVVPGLGGHAFGSFKERAGEHMWVRDALPKALTGGNDYPIARIMTYGYKSTVQNSSSVEHIGDLAESFHSSLIELARVPEMKPLVFIGHSMGGLVIKEALIILSQSRIESASRLFRATRGLAFFGVPHAGMKVESIRAMAGNSPNLPLIDSLSGENSHFLTQQLPRFNKLLDSGNPKIETIYFYETLESPTAQKDVNGKWKMNGPEKLLVSSLSASPRRSEDINVPIRRTHSDMVKFGGPHDSEWQKVSGHLKDLVCRILRTQIEEEEARLRLKAIKVQQEAQIVMDEWCSSLDFESLNMYSRGEKLLQDRLPGTCEWLLKGQDFSSWREGPAGEDQPTRILILKGKPGSGKSVMMRAALEECAKGDHGNAEVPIRLSFFFDARPSSSNYEKSEAGMYRALLLQLIAKLDPPSFLDPENSILKHRNQDKTWSPTGIQRAILSLLESLKSQKIFIFLDALDECMDLERTVFLDFLEDIVGNEGSGRTLRLCISARTPLPFETWPRTIVVDVSKRNKEDIDKFISERLGRHLRYQPWMFNKMFAALSLRASNVFLWVHLVIKYIWEQDFAEGRSEQELLDYIDHVPEQLTSLYEHLLRHISARDRNEARNLFLVLQVARKPLTIEEVRSMLECSHGSVQSPSDLKGIDIKSRIQKVSFGLVEFRSSDAPTGEVVQFIHKSFGDFLVKFSGLGILDQRFAEFGSDSIAQTHFCAFEICMRVIGYKIQSGDPAERYPFLPYAAQFWMTHARQGNQCINDDVQYFDSLDDCDGYEARKVVELFQEFDCYQSYAHYAPREEVPNTGWLKGEDSLIVFMAFEGCTKLVSRHIKSCRKCLLSVGSSTSPQSLEKAFFLAAHRGFTATAETILDGAEGNGKGIDVDVTYGNMTALYAACLKGKEETVDLLLRRGANVFKGVEQFYRFALHAASAHDDPRIVKTILRHKHGNRLEIEKLLSARTHAGYTVFHQAVIEGRTKVLDRLLHEASDKVVIRSLEQTTRSGKTPYELAVHLQKKLEETPNSMQQVPANATTLRHAVNELGRKREIQAGQVVTAVSDS